MSNDNRDMNRDPITGAPGSHPVGVGVGGTGGAVAGAVVGSLLGPIGTLVGGAVGAVAGAAAGKGVAERIDPTAEDEYWRNTHAQRPYVDGTYNYETDYSPAYAYGNQVRAERGERAWDDALESEISEGWLTARGSSKLEWEQAREAVRDAYDRSDRTYRAYEATDRHYADSHQKADYYREDFDYDSDYRPAYRYGTYARSAYPHRDWNEELEADLERNWGRARGTSRIEWAEAKAAVRDAWDNAERVIPASTRR